MKHLFYKAATVALLAVVMVGCATANKPSPEEQIKATVDGWSAAMIAKDLDKVMSFYSEKFEHNEWGDKAKMKESLKTFLDSGMLDGLQVNTANTAIKVDGGTGTAYPIDLSTQQGTATAELRFAGEESGWLIVGIDVSGI